MLRAGQMGAKLPDYVFAEDEVLLTLRLAPVGDILDISSDAQLHSLLTSLLSTLQAVHGAGFVHRDIRTDNILQYNNRWVLIDWELAGRADEKVWWHGKSLPDAVLAGELYTRQHDLWQVGKLVQGYGAGQAAVSFASQLLAGRFASAAFALQSIWTPS